MYKMHKMPDGTVMKDSDHVEAMKKGGKVVKKKTGKTRASATAIVNIHMGRKASKTPTQPPRGPSQVSQLLGVVNALANRAVGGFFAEPNKPLSAVPQVPNVLNIQPEPNRPLSAIQPAPEQPKPIAPLRRLTEEQRKMFESIARGLEKPVEPPVEPLRPKTKEEVIAKFGRPFGPTRLDLGIAPIPFKQIQEREKSRQYMEDMKTIQQLYPDVDREKQLRLLKEYRDERDKSYKQRVQELND